MIAKSYIVENLRLLDVRYRASSHPKDGFYFSKLAILELCGWIEVSMDDIIMRHCARKIKETQNHIFVERQIVRRTYGFDYDQHFRQMMIKLVGIVTTEKIEAGMNVAVHALFEAELQSLKTIRNTLAHTYSKNPPPIDTPGRTGLRFSPLFAGLKAYDTALRSQV